MGGRDCVTGMGGKVVKFALILEAKVYSILLIEVEVSPLSLKRKGWDLVLQVKSSQVNFYLNSHRIIIKVIPLKFFYHPIFFETLHNQHSCMNIKKMQ